MEKRAAQKRSAPVMRRLNRWAWAEILAALALMMAVLAIGWVTERRETEAEMNRLLSVYGEQMESRLAGLDRTMGVLLENEEDLALMGDDSESTRQHALIRLKKTLQSTLRIDPSAEWGVMAGGAYALDVQAGTGTPTHQQKEEMRRAALAAADEASGLSAVWEETGLDGEICFRRTVTRRRQTIQLYVRRSTLLGMTRRQENSGFEWAILRSGAAQGMATEGAEDQTGGRPEGISPQAPATEGAEDQTGGLPEGTSLQAPAADGAEDQTGGLPEGISPQAPAADSAEPPAEADPSRQEQTARGDCAETGTESGGAPFAWLSPLRLERSLAGTPFRLVCTQTASSVFGQLRAEIAVLLSMAALLLAFTLYLRRALRRSLIRPMAQLEKDMRKIQAGDYELRVATESDAEEFRQMTGTLNQLLEEVLQLRIRELEKQLALQEANQKYIRLQLRPHFFLNAMATVSALSAKNKNQEIQTYIDALSRNIRYMFSAGLHTVPVREELQHVQNYLKMQELKYPDCVFSYVEMPEELGGWPIPQMIIHTVVENEYKYAVSRDLMLMLLIRVSRETFQGQEVLLIEIEDDGQGYPPEVIDRINRPGGAAESDGTRVGLWSIKRLLELMYDRTGLLELTNQTPHGAVARIRVPREAVHEIRIAENEEAPRLQGAAKPAPAPEKET